MRIKGRDEPAVRRVHSYPPVGEQLDAIYKGFKALADNGFEFPAETKAWLERIAAVKEQNPVPPRPMDERFS